MSQDAVAVTPEPSSIPDIPAPAGASGWSSHGRAKTIEEILPEAKEFSPQGQNAIKSINMGLAEPSCTQIDGYGPSKFSAQVSGTNQLIDGIGFADHAEYLRWIKQLVDNSGAVVTWEQIERDGMGVLELPGGERFCVFLPPISRGYPTFSLRKHTAVSWNLDDFVARGTIDQRMMRFLQICVASHVNILFVGQMGSGKTSLLRSLAQTSVGDDEKIAVVEQVPELSIQKPLATEYLFQPTVEGYGLGEILDFNLYNGLSRLIVGEVHLEGITKMLETMIMTEGSMSTYHAYSTEQAGERMKLALQIENSNVSGATAAAFIRQAVELVVVLEKVGDDRKVMQISEVDWRSSGGHDQLAGKDLFAYESSSQRFKGVGRLDENGRLKKKFEKYGLTVDPSWFVEPEDLDVLRRGG